MSARVTPCESCQRHVREQDRTCPFCGAACAPPKPLRLIRQRLSRAAINTAGAFGALVALGDCSSPADQPMYGIPCGPDGCESPFGDSGTGEEVAPVDSTLGDDVVGSDATTGDGAAGRVMGDAGAGESDAGTE